MKQYVIDELRPEDALKLKHYLDECHGPAIMGSLYWLPIDPALYNGTQSSHESCRPFYFALELKPDALCCELLVRTNNRVRCDCIGYATEEQRNWLVRIIDSIFERLEIIN